MVKQAAKFSALCFGMQLFFMVIAYMVTPEEYKGEKGMIIVANILAIVASGVIFPIVFYMLKDTKIARTKLYLTYFLSLLITINILSLSFGGMKVIYPVSFIADIFTPHANRSMAVFQLLNPLVCFALAVWIEQVDAQRKEGKAD